MKKALLFPFLLFVSLAQAQTIITVGPGQDFLTINQAYASIPATITGPYEIHLMAGFSALSETFPIVFDARNGSSAANTIRIFPMVSGLVISTAASNTIEFNGGDYVFLDGSVEGVGDTANLKVLSTGTTYQTIMMENGANIVPFVTAM